MLIWWDQEFLGNFCIGSSRNLSMLYNPVLQVTGLYFDLQHVPGVSTFSESPPPLFSAPRLQLVAALTLMEALGTSGGTPSTFLLWPKLLASSRLLTFCGAPVYPRGVSLSLVLCLVQPSLLWILEDDLSALWPRSQPSPWRCCIFSKGPVVRIGSLMWTHIVTGVFQNSTP